MKLKQTLLLSVLATALCAAVPVFADDTAPAAAMAPATPVSAYVKPNIKHESYGKLNIVVPLTNDMQVPMKLRNLANASKAIDAWGGKMNAKVVMYAKGVAWFKSPTEEQKKMIDMLRAHGVQFVICNNSLSEQGIDYHTLYGVTDKDVVPSGFAEVAFLQAKKHFVVDPAM